MAGDGEIDGALTEPLYRATMSQFIDLRKALVAELRGQGDKTGAGLVGKLRKPSAAAWVVNQLFYQAREAWDAALTTGSELRAAQEEGGLSAQAMQAKIGAQRKAVRKLVEVGLTLAHEAGQALNASNQRKLQSSLEALVAKPDLAPHGRLDRDLEAPSFDLLNAAAVLAARPPTIVESRSEEVTELAASETASAPSPRQAATDRMALMEKQRMRELAVRKRDRLQAEHRRMTGERDAAALRLTAAEKRIAAAHADADRTRGQLEVLDRELQDTLGALTRAEAELAG